MAGGFANTIENAVLDFYFGATDLTPPATLYVALLTDSNTDTQRDAGTLTEATGTGYARVAVTNNSTNWPAASSGSKSNGTAIDFGTAGGSWGTITGVAIFTASSGGTLIAHAPLTTSKPVTSGDPVRFPASSLTFTLD